MAMKVEFPNLRHLRAFYEVGHRQGISVAAEAVFMSQPAVTQAIAGIEHDLGEPLFTRSSDGMILTSSGALFHGRVSKVLHFLAEGAAALQRPQRRDGHANTGFDTRVTSAQLRALVAVQEGGSFSLAAALVGVTQPSLHRAARDLEKLSGVPLFITRHRNTVLTEAGEIFARAVRLAWAEIRQGYGEILAQVGRDETRIVIGSMPLSRSTILPDAEHVMLMERSGVQLVNVDGPYWELLRGLRNGDIDFLIGALRDPLPSEDVEQEKLFDDPLSIVVGPDHPLVGKTHTKIEDTYDLPWIAPPITTPAGRYLFQMLKIGQMVETPVRVVSSSMVLIRELLMRGDYVTIMSRSQIRLEEDKGLMVPLDIVLPDSRRPIGLTTRLGWEPTRTQARFLKLVRDVAKRSIAKTNSGAGV